MSEVTLRLNDNDNVLTLLNNSCVPGTLLYYMLQPLKCNDCALFLLAFLPHRKESGNIRCSTDELVTNF